VPLRGQSGSAGSAGGISVSITSGKRSSTSRTLEKAAQQREREKPVVLRTPHPNIVLYLIPSPERLGLLAALRADRKAAAQRAAQAMDTVLAAFRGSFERPDGSSLSLFQPPEAAEVTGAEQEESTTESSTAVDSDEEQLRAVYGFFTDVTGIIKLNAGPQMKQPQFTELSKCFRVTSGSYTVIPVAVPTFETMRLSFLYRQTRTEGDFFLSGQQTQEVRSLKGRVNLDAVCGPGAKTPMRAREKLPAIDSAGATDGEPLILPSHHFMYPSVGLYLDSLGAASRLLALVNSECPSTTHLIGREINPWCLLTSTCNNEFILYGGQIPGTPCSGYCGLMVGLTSRLEPVYYSTEGIGEPLRALGHVGGLKQLASLYELPEWERAHRSQMIMQHVYGNELVYIGPGRTTHILDLNVHSKPDNMVVVAVAGARRGESGLSSSGGVDSSPRASGATPTTSPGRKSAVERQFRYPYPRTVPRRLQAKHPSLKPGDLSQKLFGDGLGADSGTSQDLKPQELTKLHKQLGRTCLKQMQTVGVCNILQGSSLRISLIELAMNAAKKGFSHNLLKITQALVKTEDLLVLCVLCEDPSPDFGSLVLSIYQDEKVQLREFSDAKTEEELRRAAEDLLEGTSLLFHSLFVVSADGELRAIYPLLPQVFSSYFNVELRDADRAYAYRHAAGQLTGRGVQPRHSYKPQLPVVTLDSILPIYTGILRSSSIGRIYTDVSSIADVESSSSLVGGLTSNLGTLGGGGNIFTDVGRSPTGESPSNVLLALRNLNAVVCLDVVCGAVRWLFSARSSPIQNTIRVSHRAQEAVNSGDEGDRGLSYSEFLNASDYASDSFYRRLAATQTQRHFTSRGLSEESDDYVTPALLSDTSEAEGFGGNMFSSDTEGGLRSGLGRGQRGGARPWGQRLGPSQYYRKGSFSIRELRDAQARSGESGGEGEERQGLSDLDDGEPVGVVRDVSDVVPLLQDTDAAPGAEQQAGRSLGRTLLSDTEGYSKSIQYAPRATSQRDWISAISGGESDGGAAQGAVVRIGLNFRKPRERVPVYRSNRDSSCFSLPAYGVQVSSPGPGSQPQSLPARPCCVASRNAAGRDLFCCIGANESNEYCAQVWLLRASGSDLGVTVTASLLMHVSLGCFYIDSSVDNYTPSQESRSARLAESLRRDGNASECSIAFLADSVVFAVPCFVGKVLPGRSRQAGSRVAGTRIVDVGVFGEIRQLLDVAGRFRASDFPTNISGRMNQ